MTHEPRTAASRSVTSSPVFGAGKNTAVMDPLQQATDAGDLYQ
jgi:hypothetical protein